MLWWKRRRVAEWCCCKDDNAPSQWGHMCWHTVLLRKCCLKIRKTSPRFSEEEEYIYCYCTNKTKLYSPVHNNQADPHNIAEYYYKDFQNNNRIKIKFYLSLIQIEILFDRVHPPIHFVLLIQGHVRQALSSPRPGGKNNPFSMFWVCPGNPSQLDVQKKTPKGEANWRHPHQMPKPPLLKLLTLSLRLSPVTINSDPLFFYLILWWLQVLWFHVPNLPL